MSEPTSPDDPDDGLICIVGADGRAYVPADSRVIEVVRTLQAQINALEMALDIERAKRKCSPASSSQ